MDKKYLEGLVREIIKAIGEDAQRQGLKDTPKRVAAAYEKIFEGYARRLDDEITLFPNSYKYDSIVYSGKIDFFSICEHHLLPFFGVAHIAYIPNNQIVGLSKLARAVDIYARRLQDQERITVQVVEDLQRLIQPKGLAVYLEARHFCNMARGVKQYNSNMKTLIYKGAFENDVSLQNQFMEMVR